jgi:hypothetical protein
VIEVSGELSITSAPAFEFAELLEFDEDPEPEDPHAATTIARTPAAAIVMGVL